jgi:hypothetical protein
LIIVQGRIYAQSARKQSKQADRAERRAIEVERMVGRVQRRGDVRVGPKKSASTQDTTTQG